MQTETPWSNSSWISRSLRGSCGFTRRVGFFRILRWGWSCTGVLPVSRSFHYTWAQVSPSIALPASWFFCYCNHFRGLEKGIHLRGGGVGKERGLLSCVDALTRTAVVVVVCLFICWVRSFFVFHLRPIDRRSEKACVAPCVGALRPSEKSEFCFRELHAIFFSNYPARTSEGGSGV